MKSDGVYCSGSRHDERALKVRNFDEAEAKVKARLRSELRDVIKPLLPQKTTLEEFDELIDNFHGDIERLWDKKRREL